MTGPPENRLDEIIADLLRGRRLKLRGGDAEEKAAITAAARLAGTRQGPQRMHPAFRTRLARALEETPREGWVTRRAALVAGLGLAAGAATGTVFGRRFQPQTVRGGEPINPVKGRWVDVAAIQDLVEGQGKHVVAGSVGAFLFRRGDKVTAVSSICSHLPCELWWDRGSGTLICPCHPATFAPDGHPTDPYGLPALNTVHARVTSAGRVEVLGTG
jgi:nitrite reductase/ring-hydroxylating ferredoxin subunit